MKGIILAEGSGSKLFPITQAISKFKSESLVLSIIHKKIVNY